MKQTLPRVLALDLEGTLVSSAVSQFPRPGLRDFLAWALGAFERVVVFTSVRAEVARKVMATLVEYGDALVAARHSTQSIERSSATAAKGSARTTSAPS